MADGKTADMRESELPAFDVVVVGSANVDVSARVLHLPSPGETVLATSLVRSPGGKGANQAVAAARAGGALVAFIGAVGADAEGEWLSARLAADGVDTAMLARSGDPTGQALISVAANGENVIVVAPGANATLALTPAQKEMVACARVVVTQLEIPVEAVASASAARACGAEFLLNAAPARPLPVELLADVDALIVNEHEAREISGLPDLDAAASYLVAHVPVAIITRGAAGVTLAMTPRAASLADGGVAMPGPAREEACESTVPPYLVDDVVDTTGAGDTFCGVLAAARARGLSWEDAVREASVAAALAVTAAGAQDAIPSRQRVLHALQTER